MTGPSRQMPPAERQRIAPVPDSVSAWLDVVASLLNVTEPERAEVREELESHLRDRVRDLMLGGLDSEEATTRAISELGGAAELAGRFRSVREEQRRRRLMNVLGLGVAAGAAVVSIAALVRTGVPPTPGPSSVPAAIAQVSTAEPARPEEMSSEVARLRERVAQLENQLVETKIRVSAEPFPARPIVSTDIRSITGFEEASGKPLLEALTAIANKSGLRLDVSDVKLDDARVPVLHGPVTIEQLLSNFSNTTPQSDWIQYRVKEGVLRIAKQSQFVREEVITRAYDIRELLGYGDPTGARLVNSMLQIASTGIFDISGNGTVCNVVGPTLVVSGDEVTHERVKWVLRRAILGVSNDLAARSSVGSTDENQAPSPPSAP